MSDQCGKCELRNNVDGCLREDCWQHDNWLVFALEEQRENLRAQLAEKDREITFRDKWLNQWQLKTKLAIDRAEKAEAELAELRGQNKVLREEENVPYLRELKENAELRERMKPVEEVYKWLQSDECNRWLNASAIGFILDKVVQAIKAACEEE